MGVRSEKLRCGEHRAIRIGVSTKYLGWSEHGVPDNGFIKIALAPQRTADVGVGRGQVYIISIVDVGVASILRSVNGR